MTTEEFMSLLKELKLLSDQGRQAGKYHTVVPHINLKNDRVVRLVFSGYQAGQGISKIFDERNYHHGRKMADVIIEYMSRDWHWYLD